MKRVALLLLIACSLSGAVPTPEGLFRNGNNKNPTGNVISLDLSVEEIREGAKAQYYRFFIEVREDEAKSLLQVGYADSSFSREQISSVYYAPRPKRILGQKTSVEKKLFYSLLIMMTANDSALLSSLVRSIDPSYRSNRELLNKEKVNLYKRYKDHLKNNREGPSPLDQADEAAKKVLNSSMYTRSRHVSLEKKGERFFWKAAFQNIVFLFSNEEHRVTEVLYNDSVGEATFTAGPYIRPDGTHEIPRDMELSSLDGKRYKVRAIDLKHIESKEKADARAAFFRGKQKEGEKGIFPFLF